MVSSYTLLSYPYWTIPFMLQTYDSHKQLGDVISQNDKPIAFFSRRISKPQFNYNTTKKKLLAVVKCLNQFCGVLFGYEIKKIT